MSCLAAENLWDGGDEGYERRKKTSAKAAEAAAKVLRDPRCSRAAKEAARKALRIRKAQP